MLIRQMMRPELDIAISWARGEGWNPGRFDGDAFWQTDPEGFFAMELDGKMIGSGSAVSYSGNYGFMGFFIVRNEYRGKGLGGKLWATMRDTLKGRLKVDTTIGIDGVYNMQNAYTRTGFNFSHRNLHMEGIAEALDFDKTSIDFAPLEIFSQLVSADARWFGCERSNFLKGWLAMPEIRTAIYRKGDEILGYGCRRTCSEGYKIGPLFASNSNVGEQIFRALTNEIVGQNVSINVPEYNVEAMKLAHIHNLKENFGCARMYIGSRPSIPDDEIFGITTYELG